MACPTLTAGRSRRAYPWRGRITGEPGADKTSAAGAQISGFFGSAAASDFSLTADGVDYHGPNEWSFRRFILAQRSSR